MSGIDEKEIIRRFEAVSRFTPRPEVAARDLERVRQGLTEAASRQQATGQNVWRIIVKSRITKLAAAVIVIAVLLPNLLPTSTGAKVYAAAIQALETVQTVHISGWTTHPHPRHSNALDEPLDTSTQYPVEFWEWFTENGEYRKYERQGPITVWDDGQRRYEYHKKYDRLYIDKPQRGSLSTHFQSLPAKLKSLKQRGVKITDIGKRQIGKRLAKGIRAEGQDKREEFWLDADSNLLRESKGFRLVNGQWSQISDISVTYDVEIPSDVLTYVPPDTRNIYLSRDIDPRFEKWRLHLRKLAAYYQQHPLPETMELLPRESDEKIKAYTSTLPGMRTGHWVLAIQSSLKGFLRSRFKPFGSLRIPEDLRSIKLNHDLITSNKFNQRERIDFVLEALGLEIIEITEHRKVWVAHYDGRPLKPWRKVKAPVANPQNVALRPGMAETFGPTSMKDLFNAFAYWQNLGLTAEGILIIDETGLPSEPAEAGHPESVAVSSETPLLMGKESIEIARKWFKEQFGVTFTEETRPMTVYIVRKRP